MSTRLKDALNQLVDRDRLNRTLAERAPANPIPAQTGVGAPVVAGGGGAGEAAAIPHTLKETSFGDRAYWPPKIITTTDGMFSFEVKPIKETKFKDDAAQIWILDWAEPPAS